MPFSTSSAKKRTALETLIMPRAYSAQHRAHTAATLPDFCLAVSVHQLPSGAVAVVRSLQRYQRLTTETHPTVSHACLIREKEGSRDRRETKSVTNHSCRRIHNKRQSHITPVPAEGLPSTVTAEW